MNRVPEDILAAAEGLLGSIPGLSQKYKVTLFEDALAGRSLKNYVLLTEQTESFTTQGFTGEQIFWSRYFWFLRYVKLRELVDGCDAGLEQQAFQILEYPYPTCEPDWRVLESVEMAVDAEIRIELRRSGA